MTEEKEKSPLEFLVPLIGAMKKAGLPREKIRALGSFDELAKFMSHYQTHPLSSYWSSDAKERLGRLDDSAFKKALKRALDDYWDILLELEEDEPRESMGPIERAARNPIHLRNTLERIEADTRWAEKANKTQSR